MRHPGGMAAPHWLGLYGLLLAAWGALWLSAAPGGEGWPARLRDLCLATPEAVGPGGLVAMWLLMSAAMMLPTALPAFATHDAIARAHGTGGGAALVAGYLAVWAGFAVVAAAAQAGLAEAARSPWLAVAMLAGAGAYQVSPLKDACLSRCRSPMAFFLGHWAEGPLRMGFRLGAACLGCCWALMALGLLGGAMSLGLMALATALMALEKLSRGTLVPRAIGLACLAGAGYIAGGTL